MCGFFAPGANDLIVFFASCNNVIGRNVGQAFNEGVYVLLYFCQFAFNGFDARGYISHFLLDLCGIFARFFHLRNLARYFVAFFAQLTDFGNVSTACCIPGEQVCTVDVIHTRLERLCHLGGIFAD